MSETICPNCKNPINDPDALLCHFCGSSLGRTSSGFMGFITSGQWVIAVIVVVIIIVLVSGR